MSKTKCPNPMPQITSWFDFLALDAIFLHIEWAKFGHWMLWYPGFNNGGHFILSIRVLKDEQNVYFYILFYILNSLPVLRWRQLFDTKSVNI